MTDPAIDFLQRLSQLKITHAERAVALLWWDGLSDHNVSLSPKTLAEQIESAGYGRPNVTKLRKALVADRRTKKQHNGSFKLKIDCRAGLDGEYLSFLKQRPVARSDSILPLELFENTRRYIEKVVFQINASYDAGLHDCCAVMCRRLLETLIIETYEAKGFADEIKDSDGYFLVLSGLLKHVRKETRFNLGRNAIAGLEKFKKLGDQSAHDRRFNARRQDIDRIRDSLRVASEALLHESRLAN